MKTQNRKTTGRTKRFVALIVLLGILAALAASFFIYTGIYYHAEDAVYGRVDAYAVRIEEREHYFLLAPAEGTPITGYAFYPGGKVEPQAYLAYLAEVAEAGYCCALLKVPFRLAILNTDAAARPIADNPQILTWAVGGHSLGGVASASFAAKNTPVVRGLVLLAAYSTADLSQSGLHVASITATADNVLNWDKYEEARQNLPPTTAYVSITGGNHGQFGMYGPQKGDGAASIPQQEQQSQAAAATITLLGRL